MENQQTRPLTFCLPSVVALNSVYLLSPLLGGLLGRGWAIFTTHPACQLTAWLTVGLNECLSKFSKPFPRKHEFPLIRSETQVQIGAEWWMCVG